MRIIDLNRLRAAVESITSCTAPVVQVDGIEAHGGRLCSPFKSHHLVDYRPATENYGALLTAWNGHHHLQVEGEPPAPRPISANGCVGEFVQLTVPHEFVEPLFALARRLGLSPRHLTLPESLSHMYHVFVLRPSLAGWHYGRPVFWAAAPGEGNTRALVEGEPVATQGGLVVVPQPETLPADLPTWNSWAAPWLWFFNHVAAFSDADATEAEILAEPAERVTPKAVLYNGLPRAAIYLHGPAHLVARDHDPVEIGPGAFVALHRFPDENDVD